MLFILLKILSPKAKYPTRNPEGDEEFQSVRGTRTQFDGSIHVPSGQKA